MTWRSLGTLISTMGQKPDWSGFRMRKWRQSVTTLRRGCCEGEEGRELEMDAWFGEVVFAVQYSFCF